MVKNKYVFNISLHYISVIYLSRRKDNKLFKHRLLFKITKRLISTYINLSLLIKSQDTLGPFHQYFHRDWGPHNNCMPKCKEPLA